MKVNAEKSKVKVLGGEDVMPCEIRVERARLEQGSEFKYFGAVLDESCTDDVVCRRWLVGKMLQVLLDPVGGLQLECERVLFLSPFGGTGSLGSLLSRVVYPHGSTLGDCLPFSCGE